MRADVSSGFDTRRAESTMDQWNEQIMYMNSNGSISVRRVMNGVRPKKNSNIAAQGKLRAQTDQTTHKHAHTANRKDENKSDGIHARARNKGNFHAEIF